MLEEVWHGGARTSCGIHSDSEFPRDCHHGRSAAPWRVASETESTCSYRYSCRSLSFIFQAASAFREWFPVIWRGISAFPWSSVVCPSERRPPKTSQTSDANIERKTHA